MKKAQYAIMRFAKYKGPEIGRIEAHDERTKDRYASNSEIDVSKSNQNYHLIAPAGRYRAEAEKQIAEAGCRTRSDSVRLVEVLFTASPEFFKGRKRTEIISFFTDAMEFLKKHQASKTMISAVIHMDEKTPHMHLVFVPLTEDGRLSAKDIIGNKSKLSKWQDSFWKYMVRKYPDLERGISASQTGREHIPPRVFKEMTRLNKQRERLEAALSGINIFNAKAKAEEVSKILEKYIPDVEKMDTLMKQYSAAFRALKGENIALTKQNETLEKQLKGRQEQGIHKHLQELQLKHDYEAAVALIDRIPPEILEVYAGTRSQNRDRFKDPGR